MFIHNPRVAPGKTPCQSSFTDIQDFWNPVRMQGTELDAGGESLAELPDHQFPDGTFIQFRVSCQTMRFAYDSLE